MEPEIVTNFRKAGLILMSEASDTLVINDRLRIDDYHRFVMLVVSI